MGSVGFYVDLDKCSGCRSCQIACKDRNHLPIGQLFRKVYTYESGWFPDAVMFHFSKACNHCSDPACVNHCPKGAMYIGDDSTVLHDDEKCIGCGKCVKNCPYGVPVMLDSGIAGKCDGCKPYRDAGKNPVCVDACNMRCLEFGDVDELREKHGEDLVRSAAFHPDGQTQPNTLIHVKGSAPEENLRELKL